VRHHLAISPDIHVRHLGDWYLLAARLSRLTGLPIRATYYDDFDELHRAQAAGDVDLVVANAADATTLIRQSGFLAIARPAGMSDEASVVVAADSPLVSVDDLPTPLQVAATDAPDVECICRILLEPADLDASAVRLTRKRNYTLVAKAVLAGEADAGFILRAAFDNLSGSVRAGLRALVSSHIYVVTHAFMVGPALAGHAWLLLEALERLASEPGNAGMLAGLGAPHGWQRLNDEDVYFMLDLMTALSPS
jgi:phosphonate transport system substrate-binding protein